MFIIKINDWLKNETGDISSKLIHINFAELSDNHLISFGLKKQVYELIEILRGALFPHIYETSGTDIRFLETVVSKKICDGVLLMNSIMEQVYFGMTENNIEDIKTSGKIAREQADRICMEFFCKLPDIRETLSTDIHAAYRGDPAAMSFDDVILSYPCIEAITNYRIAHELWLKKVPLIPRIITEYAHAHTGIDIHPGATIGNYFFIDHGTGVVIGETCIIGNNVKLYQGVTLGAKSFETDDKGNILNIKRHPNIEDNTIIYSGATILGGDTIVGHDSVIGGNVWLTKSVPAYSKVYNSTPFPIIKADEENF